METILGAWRLLSFRVHENDGRKVHPYGEDVTGLLLFEKNGYMSEICSGNRRPIVPGVDINLKTDAEKIAIAKDFSASSGRFELQEGKIIFHIEVSLLPALVGTAQERSYRLEDSRLILQAAPVWLGEKSFVANFTWERVA